jgi:hypothetical protein
LTGEVQDILEPDSTLVRQPAIPVTPALVEETGRLLLSREISSSGNGHHGGSLLQRGTESGPVQLTIRFKTPTRIIQQKQLVKEPRFSPLFHRLLGRLAALCREFGPVGQETTAQAPGGNGEAGSQIPFPKEELLSLADRVELVADQTTWQEVWSYSGRQGKKVPISGLVGQATYQAELETWQRLLPFLLWGSVTHVGKNTVKGEGMIGIVSCQL